MTDYLAKNLAHLLKGDVATQNAIAKAVGVSQPTISKWANLERKPREPEFRKMARVAKFKGVSLDALAWHDLTLGDVGNGHIDPASHAARLDSGKLAVSLVAVEKAIRALGMDPDEAWGNLAQLLLWSLDLQDELYPGGVQGKKDQLKFDDQVELEMRREGYGSGVGKIEQDAAGGDARRGKATPARKKARGRRARGNP